jgi:hypothetical protein
LPNAASAQQQAANRRYHGELTRIRLSKIKPGRSIADFRDAVAAPAAWYKVHGCHIEQRIAPVVTFAEGKADASQEMMIFVASADVSRQKRDVGWNSLVAKYRVNLEIERETIVSMPQG